MKNNFLSMSIVFIIVALTFCSIVHAAVGIKHGGVLEFTATDIDLGSGLNWENIQGVAFIHGVNWSNIQGFQISAVNWTGANINGATGVNWEALRVANGNTSSSINWTSFGV